MCAHKNQERIASLKEGKMETLEPLCLLVSLEGRSSRTVVLAALLMSAMTTHWRVACVEFIQLLAYLNYCNRLVNVQVQLKPDLTKSLGTMNCFAKLRTS